MSTVYVDIGNAATDSATLAFTFSTTTSTIRTWEIKVSQISCSNPNRYASLSDNIREHCTGALGYHGLEMHYASWFVLLK